MPVNPVTVTTTVTIATQRVASYGEICIVGTEAGGAAPDNTVELIDNLTDIATRFGSTTDLYYAAERIFDQGVASVYCVRVGSTNVPSEAVIVGAGVLANFPVYGKSTITLAAYTVQFTTGTPSDPGAGKIEINTKTGAIWVGTGAGGNIAYDYLDWTGLFAVTKDYSFDIMVAAMYFTEEQEYGDVDTLLDDCDSENRVMPIMAVKSAAAAGIVTLAADFSSKNAVFIAHGCDEDAAAAVAGRMSIVKPWEKMMWKKIPGLTMDAYYDDSDVATLEAGNVNAIILRNNEYDVMSDGLTTEGSTYKYIDITRTQYYLETQIITGLGDLIERVDIPYTPNGLDMVKSNIETACETAVGVGAVRAPFVNDDGDYSSPYIVQMPDWDTISSADKTARLLQNIYVTVYLAGQIQAISLYLNIQI